MKKQLAVWLSALALIGPTTALAGEDHHKKHQDPATGGSGSEGMEKTKHKHLEKEKGTGGSGMMDMSKSGPWTRKPTSEAQTKKEIQAFLKEEDAIMKSGDFEAGLRRLDFPIYMATDDSRGMPMGQTWDRQQYTEMMKPMMEQMPKDMTMTHRPNITVLSDSLAMVVDDFTMTSQGQTRRGRNAALLVKKDGSWKWKSFVEAGWGDSAAQGTGGSGEAGEMPESKEKEWEGKDYRK